MRVTDLYCYRAIVIVLGNIVYRSDKINFNISMQKAQLNHKLKKLFCATF